MIETLALAATLTTTTPADEHAENLRFQRIRSAVVEVYTPDRELVDRVIIDPTSSEVATQRARVDQAYEEADHGGVQVDEVTPATIDHGAGEPVTEYLLDDGDGWIIIRGDGTIGGRITKHTDDAVTTSLQVEVTTDQAEPVESATEVGEAAEPIEVG